MPPLSCFFRGDLLKSTNDSGASIISDTKNFTTLGFGHKYFRCVAIMDYNLLTCRFNSLGISNTICQILLSLAMPDNRSRDRVNGVRSLTLVDSKGVFAASVSQVLDEPLAGFVDYFIFVYCTCRFLTAIMRCEFGSETVVISVSGFRKNLWMEERIMPSCRKAWN